VDAFRGINLPGILAPGKSVAIAATCFAAWLALTLGASAWRFRKQDL
jgi:hypothetical protein